MLVSLKVRSKLWNPFDLFASNVNWGSRYNHKNVSNLVYKYKFQVDLFHFFIENSVHSQCWVSKLVHIYNVHIYNVHIYNVHIYNVHIYNVHIYNVHIYNVFIKMYDSEVLCWNVIENFTCAFSTLQGVPIKLWNCL